MTAPTARTEPGKVRTAVGVRVRVKVNGQEQGF